MKLQHRGFYNIFYNKFIDLGYCFRLLSNPAPVVIY